MLNDDGFFKRESRRKFDLMLRTRRELGLKKLDSEELEEMKKRYEESRVVKMILSAGEYFPFYERIYAKGWALEYEVEVREHKERYG